jgi:hypothetical protein
MDLYIKKQLDMCVELTSVTLACRAANAIARVAEGPQYTPSSNVQTALYFDVAINVTYLQEASVSNQ